MPSPFPPAFIEELRERATLHDIVGRNVRWDAGKSNPARRDWWACCPFHHEKTPSFHIDGHKGVYYCFGCGAKGDVISYVMEKERLTYPEAVRNLARHAGIPMPQMSQAASAREAEQQQRRERLRAVLQEAQGFFRAQLHQRSAGEAREHLRSRAIAPHLWERFGLGFAPAGNRLLRHLADKAIRQADMLDAGLTALGEQDKQPYDRFRNRITFPIHDAKNRLIAFGGRALDRDAPAKYLNSPETILFQKRELLYNLARARKPSQEAQSILLVEGYMDVIAMSAAGFAHVVAPLGTALGERQIALLWRLAAEPILCFDGDSAGIRAAERSTELLLEHLKPGHSMRFALLPAGKDPEDVLRQGGSAAMTRLLKDALPLDEMLWKREVDRGEWHTPEQRARLQQSLHRLVRRIPDTGVRSFYRAAMDKRLRALFFGNGRRASVSLSLRRNALTDGAAEQSRRRIRLLLYLGIRFPLLAERYGEELNGLDIADAEADATRDMLLETIAREGVPDSQTLQNRLKTANLGGIAEEFQRTDWSSPMIAEGVHRADFSLEKGDELWRHVHALERKAITRRKDIPEAVSELTALSGDNREEKEREPLYRLRALHAELASGQGGETRFAAAAADAQPLAGGASKD